MVETLIKVLTWASLIVMIPILMLSCHRHNVGYVDPVMRLLEHDSLLIIGQYDPLNEVINFCYTTNEDGTLHGGFVWNRFYAEETHLLSTHFTSGLYRSSEYVSGRFVSGNLDGELVLMRLGSSNPEPDDIDTVGMYTYREGVLDGPFYLANRTEARCRGNYKNGRLEGRFYQLDGRGTVNGVNYGNYAKWELNFRSGVYDSLQTLYLNDTIAEQVWYRAGRLHDIVNGNKEEGFYKASDGHFAYRLNSSSLYYSLVGRMFERDHTDMIRSELFGDSAFNGVIDFCDGKICNSQFSLERIINFNGETSRVETFTRPIP